MVPLASCAVEGDAFTVTEAPVAAVVPGPERSCDAPVEGFTRFEEGALARGLDLDRALDTSLRPCGWIPGGVVAQDLDADGYVDLSFHETDAFPTLYRNDGQGGLERAGDVPSWDDPEGRELYTHGFVDLDGDGLPDLLAVGAGLAVVSWNLGGLNFSDFSAIYDAPEFPRDCIETVAWGDIDADGDLDLLLPGLESWPDPEHVQPSEPPEEGTYDRLLLQEDGAFVTYAELSPYGAPGLSLLGVFTDREADGDLDLLVTSDRAAFGDLPDVAFYRNDLMETGALSLSNDAAALSAELPLNSMGVGAADLNGDALPDYCMSDIGASLICLLTDSEGGYHEAGDALGLTHDLNANPALPEDLSEDQQEQLRAEWVTWSVELIDLDNDGELDLATVGGATPDGGSPLNSALPDFQPDAIWQGSSDGFIERTHEIGFGDESWRYGMTSADLDNDGYLELITHGFEGPAQLWENPCGSGSWVEIDLKGPPGNSEGYGVRVELTAGGRSQTRELHGLRTVAQSASSLHFGLGDSARVDDLRIRWPDGAVTEATALPVNRVLTVYHPSRL